VITFVALPLFEAVDLGLGAHLGSAGQTLRGWSSTLSHCFMSVSVSTLSVALKLLSSTVCVNSNWAADR